MVKMLSPKPELEKLLSEYKGTFIYEYAGKIKLDRNKPGGSHHEWHIGRREAPLVLLTKSIYPHQVLQYLLYTFPCYSPARQQKSIPSTILMQEVDKKLGVEKSGEVVSPYKETTLDAVINEEEDDDENESCDFLFADDGDVFADKGNPDLSDGANEKNKEQADELLQTELDGSLSLKGHHALDEDIEKGIYEASTQDALNQEKHKAFEEAESSLIKLEEAGSSDGDKMNKLKAEMDSQDIEFEVSDRKEEYGEHDDSEKAAGKEKPLSAGAILNIQEGLGVFGNDVRYGVRLSQKVREEYKKEIPQHEKELVKLEKKLEKEETNRAAIKAKAFDLILNGTQKDIANSERKITKSNNKIKQLEIDIKDKKHILSILKSPRIDDKDHHSSTEKMRNTARTYIRRALSDIAGLGDEGQRIADYIDLRLATGDPVSYKPKKGDPLWSTNI